MTDPAPSPDRIRVRGARVNNLRGIDVDIPLQSLVASRSPVPEVLPGSCCTRRITPLHRGPVDLHLPPHVPDAAGGGGLRRARPRGTGAAAAARRAGHCSTSALDRAGERAAVDVLLARLALLPRGHRVPPTSMAGDTADLPGSAVSIRRAPRTSRSTPAGLAAGHRHRPHGRRRRADPRPVEDLDGGAVVPWQMFASTSSPSPASSGSGTDVPWRQLTAEEREIVSTAPRRRSTSPSPPRRGCMSSTSPSATRG